MATQDDIAVEKDLQKPPVDWGAIQTLWTRHKDSLHPYITEMYQNYYMWRQTRKDQLKKDKEEWRTNLKSPLTHMFTSGIYNMMLDSDVRFVCIDKKGKYPIVVKNILDLADYFSQQDDFMEPVWSAIFDQTLLGWGCYKTTYIYREYDVEFMAPNGKKQKLKLKDDYAASRYVSLYNMFTMASSTKQNNRMVFERRLIPSTEIQKEYSAYGFKLKSNEVKEKGQYLDTIDYDAIKMNMPYYNTTTGRDIFEDQTYNIKDKMLEVIEAHTSHTISIWVNGVFHGTYGQLGPLKKIRYHLLPFKKHAGLLHGIGVGYIVKPIQDAYDEIINMRLDNVKLAMNKMFFMDASSTLFGNTPTMKVKPGLIYKVRSVDSVKEIQTSEVKQSAYAEIDSMFTMVQGMTGVSAPMLGIQGKVERTATGSDLIKNAADAQVKQPLKAISREMAETLKEIIIMARVFMDEDTVKRICGDDEEFTTIPVEDLIRDFDFNYEMTSNSSENMQIKREQLLSLLDKQDKTLDQSGRQCLNVRAIVGELLKSFNLDFDGDLTPEEFDQLAAQFEKTRLEMQKELQGTAQPGPEGEGGSDQAAITRIAQAPGTGPIPQEFNSNPTGTTVPQQA